MIQLIEKYFPELTPLQRQQFSAMPALYEDWNAKINVVSRKDMDNFVEHHVLHSLAIAKVMRFLPDAQVLDVGTGGGFPGIPLAILFPETQFHLVDSIGKKIRVVNDVAQQLGLQNVRAEQIRAEELRQKYDFVVSRAVTDLNQFVKWVRGRFTSHQRHILPNGILYLKGGNLKQELAPFGRQITLYPIDEFFDEPFFETKMVIHLPMDAR